MPTEPELDELRRLMPLARQARRQHRPESPQGRASARVTEILASAFGRGESVRSLSDATGVSYHSVARRVRLATGANVGRPARTAPETAPDTGGETTPSAQEVPAPAEEPQPPAPEPEPEPEPEDGAPAAPRPALLGVVEAPPLPEAPAPEPADPFGARP